MIKLELIRRIDALEKSGDKAVEAWIGAPESGLAGW